MRASFSTIGSRGDVQPVVALASHLEALGQEVRFSLPDFRDWVESLGIPGTPIESGRCAGSLRPVRRPRSGVR